MQIPQEEDRRNQTEKIHQNPAHCANATMHHMVRRLLILAITGACCITLAESPNQLTAEEKKAGWRLLFDGKSLAGWDDPARKSPPADSWTIEDGCIKARAQPRLREDLISTATFGDFELSFDWRIAPGANSGVKYKIQDFANVRQDEESMRGRRFEDVVELAFRKAPWKRADLNDGKGQVYVVAFEFQLIDNQGHPDGRRGGKSSAGALYDLVAPATAASRQPGEWNTARIVVKGNQAEHWINGTKVMQTSLVAPEIAQGLARRWGASSRVHELLTGLPKSECPIGLQNHGDEAWFRSIKIRKL
jgi:hypothetical protein